MDFFQSFWFLQAEPGQSLRELSWVDAEQRARRRAGRDFVAAIGTPGKGAQAMFGGQQSAARDESPFEKVSFCDLALREGLMNFGPVIAGCLCLSNSVFRRFAR